MLNLSSGPNLVKRYDKEIRDGEAKRRNKGGISTFTEELGVGPEGMPIKIYFEWVCLKKTAKRNSVHHKKGDVYLESRSMDADYFEADLKQIGLKTRAKYVELGHGQVRVSLQIDSAGGHGTRRSRLQKSCRDDGRQLQYWAHSTA